MNQAEFSAQSGTRQPRRPVLRRLAYACLAIGPLLVIAQFAAIITWNERYAPHQFYPFAMYRARFLVLPDRTVQVPSGEPGDTTPESNLDDEAMASAITVNAEVRLERPIPIPMAQQPGYYEPTGNQPTPRVRAKARPDRAVTIKMTGHRADGTFYIWPPDAPAQGYLRAEVIPDDVVHRVLPGLADDVRAQSNDQWLADAVRNGGIAPWPLLGTPFPRFLELFGYAGLAVFLTGCMILGVLRPTSRMAPIRDGNGLPQDEAEAAAAPLLLGVHHIAIICSDYERSKTFYTDTLGLVVIAETHRPGRNSTKLDLAVPGAEAGAQVELFSFPDPPPRVTNPEARGLRHLAFAVTDLDAALAHLVARGVRAEPVRTDELTGRRFTFIRDPDDLPIELCEAPTSFPLPIDQAPTAPSSAPTAVALPPCTSPSPA